MLQIKRAAVLGSGVMGSGIAAHLANVGIPTLLLDMVPSTLTMEEERQGLTKESKQVRNRLGTIALQRLLKQKPAPFTSKERAALITVGNFEDDWERLGEVDWVIEVVVERLDVKQEILARVDEVRKANSIVSSNTSGISIAKMAEGRSANFQEHFLGTHFFNPPRYLKLLEMIPTVHTSPVVLAFMKRFGENVLGKGVVEAKDTPNFIANRIGTYGLLIMLQEAFQHGYSFGEVDSITGPLIGRPKSATFRTLDVVGLDTFVHVAANVYEHVVEEERDIFQVPDFLRTMVERQWLGSKTGQGFFLKKGRDILEITPTTMSYGPVKKLKAPSIEASKQERELAQKLQTLLYANDRAGTFLWNTLTATMRYAAKLNEEIANNLAAIDQAMKWGFGWELGPFEMWDAIGVRASVAKMRENGASVPAWVENMLERGHETFYREENGSLSYYDNGAYKPLLQNETCLRLAQIKEQRGVIKKNNGASLIDLDDGVLCLELHGAHEAIGMETIQMLRFAIEEVEQRYKGLVIGSEAKNFCVGANLAMLLMEAQDENDFELEWVVKQFQDAMMKLKYSTKPVVAAPYGMTLGGGAELCLAVSHVQAASETYMGLVETGAGLIPGGGGTKELYLNYLRAIPKGAAVDLQKVANQVFETVALAKVSTSAQEAKELGFLEAQDNISVNRDQLLYAAKQRVLALHEANYQPPIRKRIPVVGETGYGTLLLGAQAMHLSGYISEHDLLIAKQLAYVIAGGRVPYGTEVDEQYLLELERKAFVTLIKERKSQERMQHLLLKGKPLRN